MIAQRHVLRCLLGKMVWVGVMHALPLFLFAQNSGPADSPAVSSNNDLDSKAWWKGITADGFLSLSYTYNTNNPAPRVNQFRVFDFNDDDPQLDVAQLVIQRPVSESGQFGFRLNLPWDYFPLSRQNEVAGAADATAWVRSAAVVFSLL